MILYVLLALKLKQEDFTDEFLRADVEDDENIFVEMPKGLWKKLKVLKPRKDLYGLQKFPVASGNNCGLVQYKFDLCLFIGKKFTYIVYVYDLLFWAGMKLIFMSWLLHYRKKYLI